MLSNIAHRLRIGIVSAIGQGDAVVYVSPKKTTADNHNLLSFAKHCDFSTKINLHKSENDDRLMSGMAAFTLSTIKLS